MTCCSSYEKASAKDRSCMLMHGVHVWIHEYCALKLDVQENVDALCIEINIINLTCAGFVNLCNFTVFLSYISQQMVDVFEAVDNHSRDHNKAIKAVAWLYLAAALYKPLETKFYMFIIL